MMKKRGLGLFLIRRLKRRRMALKSGSSRTKKAIASKKTRVPPSEAQLPVVLSQPEPHASSGLSLQELIRPSDAFRQSIEGFLLDQRSEHTRRAYGKDLKRFIRFLLMVEFEPTQELKSINRRLIIQYKESLLQEKLEHTSIDRHLSTLRSFFRWLMEEGLLQQNPVSGVKYLNPKRLSKTRGFTDEEVRKILSLPNLHSRVGSMHYAILMILFHCGLRRAELCSLRTSQIFVERGQRLLKLTGKGNTERLIVLVPPVWDSLEHYFLMTRKKLKEDQFIFSAIREPSRSKGKDGIKNRDYPLNPSYIYYIVVRYKNLAGIAHRVSPHSCRATAISNARDHEVPDRAIQEFAGWSSPEMITRYDKRKSSIENSASHSIHYGNSPRILPKPPEK